MDKSNDIVVMVDRLMRERLEQFDVPSQVRTGLRNDLMALFERPEKKPYGAVVMTPEASYASDVARKNKNSDDPESSKPTIM